MKDKCKDCYFSDNGDCTCSGVKMCVSSRDERRQTMNNKSLCDSCMYAGSCADSDKGLSFANHTICWKYEEQEVEND